MHGVKSCNYDSNIKIKSVITLIILILVLVFSNAQNKKGWSEITFDSGYSLYQDTIFVDIKGDITHALKYQDKFYVIFEQRVLKYGGYGKRWLYIFSNGQVEKIIDFPKEMKAVYLDFYVKYDRLILKPYMDMQSYYLDLKKYCWTKINKTDDLIFEDEDFFVYSLDFGEWGGKTWFKEKKTGREYVIEATTPLVNKIDSTYYLTNSFQVLKINNPRLLNKCSDDITYENIESTGKSYSWYGKPIGFVYDYQDTTYNDFDFEYHPHIVSSFVLNNELLHVYETDTATYIARHKDYSIKPIQKIADNIRFYKWQSSYRCKNLNRNNELLKFETKDERMCGLLEIIDNKIYIHYISNRAELKPKPMSASQADSIFLKRFYLIYSNLGNLRLNEVDFAEQNWKSFDITPNHKMGIGESYYPNTNKFEIDTLKSYLIQEDTLVSNSIIYYATKENGLIRAVLVDWEELDFSMFGEEEQTKEVFRRKLLFLENYFTQEFGSPTKVKENNNYSEKIWTTPNGFTIHLENTNSIRLIIFKD